MTVPDLISELRTRVGSIRVRTSREAAQLVEQAHGLVIDLMQRVNGDERTWHVLDDALARYQPRVALQ